MHNFYGGICFEIWVKEKKQKLKNTIFDGPLIVNQTFSQTEYFIGESDFAHIMNFH